jgi:hypothetical protein
MRIALGWILATVVIFVGCAAPPAVSTVPVASTIRPEPTTTVTPTTSATTPSATPIEADLTDQLVAVVTKDLVVRSRPGTGQDSEIYMGRLNAPTIVYVIDGPEAADGYAWYLVDPLVRPCVLECVTVDPRSGWVAAAGKEGERWLAEEPEHGYPCPEPTLHGLLGSTPPARLYCFSGQELTLRGVIGTDIFGEPPDWAWEHRVALYGPDYQGPITGCMDACPTPLWVAFDDDAGLPPPPMGSVRVTGHFDDDKAEECRWRDFDQRLATYSCRTEFVATSWE